MSLASGIKLAAIRMTDLIDNIDTKIVDAPKKGYLAPHLRSAQPAPTQEQPKIDMANFPSLGSPIASASVTSAASVSPSNFKATVDAFLEKERQDVAMRGRVPETDVMKMTKEEQEAEGWAVLDLTRASAIHFPQESSPQPEIKGHFTFAEMAALCHNYEKRADREMDVFRDHPISTRAVFLKKKQG